MNAVIWSDPLFRETVLLSLGFILALASIIFPFRKKHPGFTMGWVSLQSWLLAAPVFFFFMGLGGPWPLIFITFISVLGAKEFFQMTGIYHRVAFVWAVYVGIFAQGLSIYWGFPSFYDSMPMIVLGGLILVPLIQNKFKNMLQYISLSLIGFILLGWGYMHLGRLLLLENGVYCIIYIVLVTEVSDNVALAAGRVFGRIKLAENISSKRTLEGLAISLVGTVAVAYGMRHLLPERTEPYWIASAAAAFFAGSLGDLIISVIRRDLGLKDLGAFVLARGGILSAVDRSIFVAPIFYHVLNFLKDRPPL